MSCLCTGLFHNHKLKVTVLKTSSSKSAHKELHCRDYIKFNSKVFKYELRQRFTNNVNSYEIFENIFLTLLNKHTP